MNKFYLLALFFIGVNVSAQTISAKKQSEKVKGDKLDGYAAEFEGKFAEVNSQWNKFIKDIGRIKLFSSDPVVITEPVFNGTVYPKGIVYAHIFENGNTCRVWLGIQPSEWEEKDVTIANQQLEKLINQFGVQYQRFKVQGQINETLEATAAVERQKQKLINMAKDLALQLNNNEQEKIHLEKSLQNNKLENEALKIKIEKNKKAQDSLVNVGEQIKKMTTTHQEKLRKIN
ncbi:MAG TPA: hypothetical protein DGG95_09055 [Cytophagales bacterium]|jgi:hypothetical protein|nr:hypothetical protein [Cytophagales bacterium]